MARVEQVSVFCVRRQWSKKYPICIVLNSGNTIATPDETADLEVDEIRPVEEKELEKEEKKEETPASKKVTTSAKYAKSSTESLELTILRSDDSVGDLTKEAKSSETPSRGKRLRTSSSKEGTLACYTASYPPMPSNGERKL